MLLYRTLRVHFKHYGIDPNFNVKGGYFPIPLNPPLERSNSMFSSDHFILH